MFRDNSILFGEKFNMLLTIPRGSYLCIILLYCGIYLVHLFLSIAGIAKHNYNHRLTWVLTKHLSHIPLQSYTKNIIKHT